MSWIDFVLSCIEHEKSFITSGPGRYLIIYEEMLTLDPEHNFSNKFVFPIAKHSVFDHKISHVGNHESKRQ